MRARLRALAAWYRRPQTARAIQLFFVGAGLNSLGRLLKEHNARLEEIERTLAQGTAALDDVATLADLERAREDRLERMQPDGSVEEPGSS